MHSPFLRHMPGTLKEIPARSARGHSRRQKPKPNPDRRTPSLALRAGIGRGPGRRPQEGTSPTIERRRKDATLPDRRQGHGHGRFGRRRNGLRSGRGCFLRRHRRVRRRRNRLRPKRRRRRQRRRKPAAHSRDQARPAAAKPPRSALRSESPTPRPTRDTSGSTPGRSGPGPAPSSPAA